jgi:hypothetical protein
VGSLDISKAAEEEEVTLGYSTLEARRFGGKNMYMIPLCRFLLSIDPYMVVLCDTDRSYGIPAFNESTL